MQSGLIVLDRQDVVARAFHDGRGDLLLAAQGVDGDDLLAQVEQLQQLRDSRDLIGLGLDRDLPQGQAGLAGPGADDVQRPQALGLAAGTLHDLAIDVNGVAG